MTADYFQLVVIAVTLVWVTSALLTLSGAATIGPLLNGLVSATIGAASLPTLGAALIDRQEYIRRYGEAAVQQLPLALGMLALSLIGICLSLAALWRGLGPFVIGWFANAPIVAFALYLAFWFHLF